MSDVFLCFVVVNMFHTTTDSINCYFFPSFSFYNRPKAAPYYGGTSLFIQCSKGNIEMVQTLIKNGIDINAIHPYTKVDGVSRTPLESVLSVECWKSGQTVALIELLKKNGVKLMKKSVAHVLIDKLYQEEDKMKILALLCEE